MNSWIVITIPDLIPILLCISIIFTVMINRILQKSIEDTFFKGKAILLIGPRQTGKTTLMQKILESRTKETLMLDGDDPTTQSILNRPNIEHLRQLIGTKKIVFIDEAQRIDFIGLTAKMIVDQLKEVQLVLSGSSAFELNNHINEPLTGRKWTFYLWPVSWYEWQEHIGFLEAERDLENRLVFGLYPDVLNFRQESVRVLKELTESYLYKDVLMLGNLKKPPEFQKLLKALAWQVGNEVSLSELGQIVGVDPKTIDKYITLLQQAYVVFTLSPLSKNLRNEIKANRKIYFYDNGVRNALIGKLEPLTIRQDVGVLWENFLMSERLKYVDYQQILTNRYFWRTRQQQEIDYVEEREGKYFGYEFKWNPERKVRFSTTFTNAYLAQNTLINRQNFRDFIAPTER